MKYKQISKILSLGFIVLIMGIGIMAVRAQDEQPTAGYTFFFPAVDNSWHIISGQVLSHQNVPIAGVTINTDHGQSAITDQNGEYALKYLTEGTYSLTPYLSGVAFSPNSSSVVVPPDVIRLNFTADVACSETLVNGGFEGSGGWEFPTTEYTAGYDTSQAHNGSRAARTGITNPADNRYSYSSTRQVVNIPSNATSAYLTFWIKPYSGSTSMLSLPAKPTIGSTLSEVPMAGDVQYVLVLANDKTTILDTLVWQLSDSRTWTEYSFNLTTYKGKTIWLHFGTYNDGYSGVSSMFVDDVSVELCPGGGSPTPSPTPGPCSNLFLNPSFETSSAWEIPITEYSAGYSSAQKHTGSWSMRTGITTAADNRYSYSDFRQSIRIPSYTSISKVGFWLYTQSGEAKALTQLDRITPTGRPFNETILSGDLQYVLVLDQYQNWIDTLVWQRTSEGYWHYYEFDLRRYVGTSIYLQFGTYNDGVYGITSMYVDDVSLYDCVSTPTPSPSPTTGPSPTPTQTPTITPTPTNTPTPGPCSELIVNSNFDGSNGWEIPITAYSAGYSNSEYHSAFRSMRTGIVNAADNRWSYSDFRQTVGIPWNANHVTLGMWMLPISGEVLTQALPPKPAIGSQFTQSPMSGDVQYLLVMDVNYNILDVLSWQLSDSETWINKQFDMSNYRGWTILLQWGTYNNGGGGISAMYVDDVTLQVCP